MFFKLKSYLSFLLRAFINKREYPPFIFNLVTNCFNKKTSTKKYSIFKQYKSILLKRKDTIKVTDFGAGSTFFSSKKRQIYKIAQVAGISNKRAKLLIRLVTYFKPENILEIGTSLGLATTAITISNSKSKVTTLEGCPETAKIAKQEFDRFHFKSINLIIGDFSETLLKTLRNNTFDFIYFDGNHQKKATLKYFNTCLETTNNNAVFIFDDIYWNKEMNNAWVEIKKHPKTTITIDTFQWGIVFFKEQKNKQHFTIKV